MRLTHTDACTDACTDARTDARNGICTGGVTGAHRNGVHGNGTHGNGTHGNRNGKMDYGRAQVDAHSSVRAWQTAKCACMSGCACMGKRRDDTCGLGMHT